MSEAPFSRWPHLKSRRPHVLLITQSLLLCILFSLKLCWMFFARTHQRVRICCQFESDHENSSDLLTAKANLKVLFILKSKKEQRYRKFCEIHCWVRNKKTCHAYCFVLHEIDSKLSKKWVVYWKSNSEFRKNNIFLKSSRNLDLNGLFHFQYGNLETLLFLVHSESEFNSKNTRLSTEKLRVQAQATTSWSFYSNIISRVLIFSIKCLKNKTFQLLSIAARVNKWIFSIEYKVQCACSRQEM